MESNPGDHVDTKIVVEGDKGLDQNASFSPVQRQPGEQQGGGGHDDMVGYLPLLNFKRLLLFKEWNT